MERLPLIPHPDFPPPAGVGLSARWAMNTADGLTIAYHVADPDGRILWPAPAIGRSDNLWQHTCFEAFIGSATGIAYTEYNLSPSGAWAAYAFDDYRAAMRDLELAAPPQIFPTASNHWDARLDMVGLDDLIGPPPWRLAITAVIEARDGCKSYWSLAHPPGKPDFHHADCFAARLG
jgi:hypothetical protein